jgi:hypothetical protein
MTPQNKVKGKLDSASVKFWAAESIISKHPMFAGVVA